MVTELADPITETETLPAVAAGEDTNFVVPETLDELALAIKSGVDNLLANETLSDDTARLLQRYRLSALNNAYYTGTLLLEAKRRIDKGFTKWLTTNFENVPGLSVTQAYSYMHVAEHWELVKDAPGFVAAVNMIKALPQIEGAKRGRGRPRGSTKSLPALATTVEENGNTSTQHVVVVHNPELAQMNAEIDQHIKAFTPTSSPTNGHTQQEDEGPTDQELAEIEQQYPELPRSTPQQQEQHESPIEESVQQAEEGYNIGTPVEEPSTNSVNIQFADIAPFLASAEEFLQYDVNHVAAFFANVSSVQPRYLDILNLLRVRLDQLDRLVEKLASSPAE